MVRRKSISRKPAPRVARRVLVGIVALAVVFFVGYAAAAKWLLSGPRLRALINTTPETSWIEYDSAVSIWPGIVRLKNIRIRGSDQNVQWIVRIAEARAEYAVGALFARTFRVTRLTGSGLSFRLREKIAPDKTVSNLPPIEGFSDPPLRKTGPETPPPEDPWTVEVGAISLNDFEEIWFDAYRFQGEARLRGQFHLRPGQQARVGPAEIEFQSGKLALAGRPVVANLAGRLGASIAEWDPRLLQGDAVWRNASAQIDLHGPVQGLEFLNVILEHSEEPRFAGGRGVLSIKGEVERGIATGRAHLAVGKTQARFAKVDLTGHLRAAVRVVRWDLEGNALEFSGSRVELTDVAAAGTVDSRDWWGKLDFPEARWEKSLRAKVKLECRDARPMLAALGVALPRWTGSLATLEGLTASANLALATTRTDVRELEARGGKYRILGNYVRLGSEERGVFLIEGGVLRVGVRVGDGPPRLRLFGPRSWFEKESTLIAQTSREDTEKSR